MSQLDTTSQEAYEQTHVHEVYEQIASHFSATRYKPWPVVAKFLQSIPPGSVGVDLGCGNGKYFDLNSDLFVLGSDRSTSLAQIASNRSARSDCIVSDGLAIPHHYGRFDFALSIAVIHHFSTSQRRIAAVAEALGVIRPEKAGGKALFFVWALEQQNSRRGWSASDEQDVMVPWVTKGQGDGQTETQTFNRYYHLYREGELAHDIERAGGRILEVGYDRDNWWAIAVRQENSPNADILL